MPADMTLLAHLRPGLPDAALRAALGSAWKAPGRHAEGHLFYQDFGTRLTTDGRLGWVSFRSPFPQPDAIGGVALGMAATAFHALHPAAVRVPDARDEYGWSFHAVRLPDGLELVAGVKEDEVRILTLEAPDAAYPERPYKYADPALTEAFDLTLADPVPLDPVPLDSPRPDSPRPEHGWCFGLPPGIPPGRWPVSAVHGTPLRHAFTLKLPAPYRCFSPDHVAIALFADAPPGTADEVEGLADWAARLGDDPAAAADPVFGRFAPLFRADDPARFALPHWDGTSVLIWLTQAEFDGPLGAPPDMASLPADAPPGWLTLSPVDYHGADALPEARADRPVSASSVPGGFALDAMLAAARPPSGWRHLPAADALRHGWPILIAPREDDPNVGRPARELDHQNALSGYVPVWSEEGERLGLERFSDWQAHLGGTMFPAQGYPDFSASYLEFTDTFGGFAFAGGTAQLDLKEMALAWAR